MLSKEHRLNLRKDFQRVVGGQMISTPRLRLYYQEGDYPHPRVGVAIPTKSFPKAHLRNRAKRLVFAAFAQLMSDLPRGIEIIALPNPRVFEVKSDKLAEELKAALSEKGF